MPDVQDLLTVPARAVADVLRSSYRLHADRPAVADSRRTLTYGELHLRARAVAESLRKLGVQRGDRVMLVGVNSVEWVEVDHGCHLGGFVRVAPLARLHPEELAQIAEDSGPVVLLADHDWLAKAGAHFRPPSVKAVVTIGAPLPGTMSYEEFIAAGEGTTTDPPLLGQDDDVWLLYTSGSTGMPRGVRLSGHAIGAMTRNVVESLPGLSEDDVMLHTAPLSHFSGALGLGTFAVGALNVLHPSFEVDEVAVELASGRISALALVPTQITMLTDELLRRRGAGAPVDTSALRTIVYSGSAIAPDRLERAKNLFGPVMVQFYGASESPMPMATLSASEHTAEVGSTGLPRLASAGRPTRFVELRIADEQGPSGAPANQVGEIECRGEHVMTAYWSQPEATAEALNDGWLRTGDVGVLDDDGYLYIVDRRKDMIVSGGFNVYPREVENVISRMNGIREVAVVGAPSEKWGEEITAVVSLQPGTETTHDQVIAFCRGAIAGYKVPKRVIVVDDLPKGGTGKIQKSAIREDMWAGHARRV